MRVVSPPNADVEGEIDAQLLSLFVGIASSPKTDFKKERTLNLGISWVLFE